MDLFSRQIVGWSMASRMETDPALNALLMAVWRRIYLTHDEGRQDVFDYIEFLQPQA